MTRKYGFNMQWMFQYHGEPAKEPDLHQLDFIAKHDFNFIRIPMDYKFWTLDFDYTNPDNRVLDMIDGYIDACRSRGLHVCLNMHRAPGYCRNHNSRERDNLWTDKIAQDGFVYIWEYFAKKYKGISNSDLSFNLLNEPPVVGTYEFTRENHQLVMRRTIDAIRAIDTSREIILDGIGGGGQAIPELVDTDVIHSGRGYEPFYVSHYRASWLDVEVNWPDELSYPCLQMGEIWDRARIMKDYQPWRDIEAKGAKVHIGEFGCHNNTPTDVANAWLADVLSIYKELKWGYALWHFEGSYGVVNHGKPGAKYEMVDGFNMDRELFELLLENRIKD